jgi:hypothetical protein
VEGRRWFVVGGGVWRRRRLWRPADGVCGWRAKTERKRARLGSSWPVERHDEVEAQVAWHPRAAIWPSLHARPRWHGHRATRGVDGRRSTPRRGVRSTGLRSPHSAGESTTDTPRRPYAGTGRAQHVAGAALKVQRALRLLFVPFSLFRNCVTLKSANQVENLQKRKL